MIFHTGKDLTCASESCRNRHRSRKSASVPGMR